ncbi:granulocyte colony-stimulating factor receptor isoform X1 [Danio rerio]|uniref:Colony-stimulating factor 3 receptor (granulocyte) n=3 Tax=Danio rerio TaxID=7955 RepID=F1R904_DANRE|nr:granulocyte colony-stimulating factor receptor isoform X1 [Danio rerio]|eukprot:XP_005173508.1 granulocyte colony-stimulating factor receptor isoform X1 [Danio rerio]
MASVSLVLLLWMYIYVVIKVTGASSCGNVYTPAPVVLAGSPVSVSCSIEEDCPLTKGKVFYVQWRIDGQVVPRNYTNQESNMTYSVLIPRLQDTSASILCLVCVQEDCQIVDGVEVKNGNPPVPHNLSCALTLVKMPSLRCDWNPVQEIANLPTNYTLHLFRAKSQKVYAVPPGQHFYVVPRDAYGYFTELEISVTAANVFGNTTTDPLKLTPLNTVKFDPPSITRIEAHRYGCLKYSWSLSETQKWLQLTFIVQLRLKTVNNQPNKDLVYTSRQLQLNPIEVCSLLHWTDYRSTVRVKYYATSEWSEWSDPKTATTLNKAPAGRLDTWLKVNNQTAQLYWKPSQQFRANGQNLSYSVDSKDTKKRLCVTTETYCFFSLTKWDKKISLRARNEVGFSDHNEVPVAVHRNKGLEPVSNFSVHPQSNTSLHVIWKSPAFSNVTSYVLEWRSLCGTTAAPLSFTLIHKNKSNTTLTGLEPSKPYEISIYPRYVKGIGRPVTVLAYSSEKAPSDAPELNYEEISRSHLKFHWGQIPLEKRNGIIQGYRFYFWHNKNEIKEIMTTETSVEVKDLQPHTKYHALLSICTKGGCVNGSFSTLTTERLDGIEMVIFVIPACIGASLLVIIIVFTCFGKQERVKMCLWPIIPDPANSSIKRWTTTDSLQGLPAFKEDKDPVLVYLSHLSLLDMTEKEPFKSGYVKENQWPDDLNIHADTQSCDLELERESVPYATVLFSTPYQINSSNPPAYVRSESTQPLLAGDEPGSPPPPYENVPRGGAVSALNRFSAFSQSTQSEESDELWEEFPMLRSLEVNHI